MAQTGSTINQTVVISEAIAAARSGQKDLARQLLQEITDQDPSHEQGFLWLAALAETPAAAIGHLERVLELNPHNAQALNALAVHRVHADNRVAKELQRPVAATSQMDETPAGRPTPVPGARTATMAAGPHMP